MRCMRYWCDAKLVDSAATYPARRFLARSACRSLIAPHRALANEETHAWVTRMHVSTTTGRQPKGFHRPANNTSKRRAVTAPSPLEVRMEELARSLGLAPGASSSAPPSDDPARVPRPTPREARDILRQLGVPCASEAEIAWVSTPAPYRRGRLRLAVLTRHLLVYARGLDPLQAAYERGSGGRRAWDLDWTGAVENLAFASEAYSTEDDDVRVGADDDGNRNGGTTWSSFTAAVDRCVRSFTAETSAAGGRSSSTGPDRRAALVSLRCARLF